LPDEPAKPRDDGKPDWLPAKFKSEEDLAKSYRELERKQFTRRDEIKAELKGELEAEQSKGLPKAPVDYTFTPIKAKDGKEIQLNPDDPLTKWFQNVAWEMKIPQAKFEKLVGDYIKVDMTRGPDWAKEGEALGPQADQRLGRIDGWARGHLPQELYNTFARIPATAELVKMFEHVMTLSGEPSFVPDDSGAGFKENLTKDDLAAMMKDEKYWREKDPRFIAQVRAGFRKLANH
jgi:hypothetical protein